jgi:hypothetical protein
VDRRENRLASSSTPGGEGKHVSNAVNNSRSNIALPQSDQQLAAPTGETSRPNRSAARLDQSGANPQRQFLNELSYANPLAAQFGNALDASPTPLRAYDVQIASDARLHSPDDADKGEGIKPLPGQVGVAYAVSQGGIAPAQDAPESPGRAHALARQYVERFNSERNRDELYPTAVVSIKKEYEGINREKSASGEKVWPISFPPVALSEEDWIDLEDHIDNALRNPSPDHFEARVQQAVSSFLRKLASERVSDDWATSLCRLMFARTEMSPEERWTVMNSMVKSESKNPGKAASQQFYDKIDRKVAQVFIERGQTFVTENLIKKLTPHEELRFFPQDILSLRSAYGNWQCQLPRLPVASEIFLALYYEISVLVSENKPLTEIPEDRLKQAFEETMQKQAESIVGSHPLLFAFRAISQRGDLTDHEKLALAVQMDGLIFRKAGEYLSDPANSLKFHLQYGASQQAEISLLVLQGAQELIAARTQ